MGIVTAWNPYSQRRGRLRNAVANALLWPVLRRRGRVMASRGSSTDPQAPWMELGYAVLTDDAPWLARVGARFGQHAAYLARPEGLEVVACAS